MVEEQAPKRIDDSKPAKSATRWLRPELSRFEAGAAEFGDVSSADAQPGFS
jgi:hypothetical protein